MVLDSGKREELAGLWLKSRTRLSAAEGLLREGFFDDAVNRSYYAVFTAMVMVHVLHDEQWSSHSAVIGNFNKKYVLGGAFPRTTGRFINELFGLRQKADYDHLLTVSEDVARDCLYQAREFLTDVRSYVERISPGTL
jgi:uncharacterized protein (UPF0332 family)